MFSWPSELEDLVSAIIRRLFRHRWFSRCLQNNCTLFSVNIIKRAKNETARRYNLSCVESLNTNVITESLVRYYWCTYLFHIDCETKSKNSIYHSRRQIVDRISRLGGVREDTRVARARLGVKERSWLVTICTVLPL